MIFEIGKQTGILFVMVIYWCVINVITKFEMFTMVSATLLSLSMYSNSLE